MICGIKAKTKRIGFDLKSGYGLADPDGYFSQQVNSLEAVIKQGPLGADQLLKAAPFAEVAMSQFFMARRDAGVEAGSVDYSYRG